MPSETPTAATNTQEEPISFSRSVIPQSSPNECLAERERLQRECPDWLRFADETNVEVARERAKVAADLVYQVPAVRAALGARDEVASGSPSDSDHEQASLKDFDDEPGGPLEDWEVEQRREELAYDHRDLRAEALGCAVNRTVVEARTRLCIAARRALRVNAPVRRRVVARARRVRVVRACRPASRGGDPPRGKPPGPGGDDEDDLAVARRLRLARSSVVVASPFTRFRP